MKDKKNYCKIYDVYWEGPFSLNEIINNQTTINCDVVKRWHSLYQIYGDHPCYGHDILLYIGRTEQGIKERFEKHWNRFSNQCDEVKIFLGSFNEFRNWKTWKRISHYQPATIKDPSLDAIESLLIYSHQPAYNSRELCSTKFKDLNIRIFNTGRRKSLLPEMSTEFYRDNINVFQERGSDIQKSF